MHAIHSYFPRLWLHADRHSCHLAPHFALSLHRDDQPPRATVVAMLSKPNALPCALMEAGTHRHMSDCGSRDERSVVPSHQCEPPVCDG